MTKNSPREIFDREEEADATGNCHSRSCIIEWPVHPFSKPWLHGTVALRHEAKLTRYLSGQHVTALESS